MTETTLGARWQTLAPGPELDALVDHLVFGSAPWEPMPPESTAAVAGQRWRWQFRDDVIHIAPPAYSTAIADAWRVVDRMRAERPFTLHDVDGMEGTWMATFEVVAAGRAGRGRIFSGEGPTAPLAICRAALAAAEAAP
jgi:hypothetical protein